MNVPNFTYDLNNYTTYNTGCAMDLNKLAAKCTDFKLQVFDTFKNNFLVSYVIMVILIIFRMYMYYSEPKWIDNEWRSRIIMYSDFAIICIILCDVAILFFI